MEKQNYIINAGPRGTFHQSENYCTEPRDVDILIEQIKAEKPEQITFFFHGGLVKESLGIETALRLYPLLKTDNNLPLFLVWETGLIETIKNEILDVGVDKLFNTILRRTIQVMEKRLGLENTGGKGMSNWTDDKKIAEELKKTRPFDHMEKTPKIVAKGAAVAMLPSEPYMLEGLLREDFDGLLEHDHELKLLLSEQHKTGAKGLISIATLVVSLAKIGFRIIKRHQNDRDHGFFPTIVEEIFRQFYLSDIGSEIWGNMKEKAHLVWKNNQGLTGNNQHAGRYLFDHLAIYAEQMKNEGRPIKINLVGHSAGSIVICELLKEIAITYPHQKFNHILLLAPACRTDLFVNEVVKHPERFNKLHCFTMSDANECKDTLVPHLYTRSLLYFISGVLEAKGKGFDEYILGMERYLNNKEPYDIDENLQLVRDFFIQEKNQYITSESLADALVGFRTTSLKHGDFDENEATIESIYHILNS